MEDCTRPYQATVIAGAQTSKYNLAGAELATASPSSLIRVIFYLVCACKCDEGWVCADVGFHVLAPNVGK